jgi:ABC-2 type transport system permease protein
VTVLRAHVKAQTVELARYPAFAVPTLALPAILFLFFGLPRSSGRANVLLASFAAYAVLSVAFFQFGVGIAGERARPWEVFVRTLPVGIVTRLCARAVSALAFATASAAIVVVVALVTTDAQLSRGEWARLAIALLAGSVPFTALGVALGYWVAAKGALPVANILYLSLAYVGGLWTGPSGLPDLVTQVARGLPTREWAQVLWPAATGRAWSITPWLVLGAYTVAFSLLAAWGYRRDEGQRYS